MLLFSIRFSRDFSCRSMIVVPINHFIINIINHFVTIFIMQCLDIIEKFMIFCNILFPWWYVTVLSGERGVCGASVFLFQTEGVNLQYVVSCLVNGWPHLGNNQLDIISRTSNHGFSPDQLRLLGLADPYPWLYLFQSRKPLR